MKRHASWFRVWFIQTPQNGSPFKDSRKVYVDNADYAREAVEQHVKREFPTAKFQFGIVQDCSRKLRQ